MLSLLVRGVRSGFDREDEAQERRIGFLLAERCKPGDKWAARSRGIVRVARHRKKEAQWNKIRVPIVGAAEKGEMNLRMDQIMVHEILDLLPYIKRREVMDAMLSNDMKQIMKAGRIVREELPGLEA
jgi:hypothetical protein